MSTGVSTSLYWARTQISTGVTTSFSKISTGVSTSPRLVPACPQVCTGHVQRLVPVCPQVFQRLVPACPQVRDEYRRVHKFVLGTSYIYINRAFRRRNGSGWGWCWRGGSRTCRNTPPSGSPHCASSSEGESTVPRQMPSVFSSYASMLGDI